MIVLTVVSDHKSWGNGRSTQAFPPAVVIFIVHLNNMELRSWSSILFFVLPQSISLRYARAVRCFHVFCCLLIDVVWTVEGGWPKACLDHRAIIALYRSISLYIKHQRHHFPIYANMEPPQPTNPFTTTYECLYLIPVSSPSWSPCPRCCSPVRCPSCTNW